jgi:hypothetical protein
MANLYDKAGLVNIPVGYQDGFLYNIKPEDNTLGFRFNRDSAATRVNKEGLIEQVGYFGPELVQNGNFSELGPELVVNGNFATDSDWTKGSAWTISNGKASCDGSQSTSNLYQTIGSFVNKTFLVEGFASNVTQGFAYISLGGSDLQIVVNSSGSFKHYVNISSGNDRLFISARNNFIGSIDNVSVKEVGQDWSFGTGWSISGGKAICDGTQSTTSGLIQNNVFENNKKYKLTFDLTSNGQELKIWVNGSQYINSFYSSNTYTLYINTNTSGNVYFEATVNFIGSIDNISVIEVLGDKPRIDYTDSLTSPSFLLEPQSTNSIEYSENFSSWTKTGNTTISSTNVTSPSGENNATNITGLNGSGGNDLRFFPSGFNSANKTLCFSVYFKGSGTLRLQMSNGVDQGIEQSITLTDNWKRHQVSGTFNSTSSGSQFHCNIDDSSSSTATSYDVWGAQVEEKSYATSYIPTAGSTVTRAQEACNDAGNVSTFNSTEGVLYAEMAALTDDQTSRAITLSDGTTNNEIRLYFNAGSSNQIVAFLNLSGTYQCVLVYTSSDITQQSKIAFKYKQNDFSLYIDGVERATDTSGNTFSSNTLNELSFAGATNLNNLYGKVKGVYVFNEALTDDELQQLTGPEYNSFAALAAAYNYTVI